MDINKRVIFNLDISECRVLKGIAIMMICLHNYCHWLPSATSENEYVFNLTRSLIWFNDFINGGPRLILNLFSFWGHYGVPLFLFLSGYGLVKKYESANSQLINVTLFMKQHYIKLWKLLLGAAMIHIIVCKGQVDIWLPLLFTFISNLIPHCSVVYGPWWFFSLIIQCYFLYAVCFYQRNKYIPFIAALLSIFLMITIIVINAPWQILFYIKFNVFGWIAPFALGVLLARYQLKISVWAALMSMAIFFLCEFNKYSWVFGSIFICLGIIPLVKFFNIKNLRVLEYIGVLSPMIFVIHPFARGVAFYLLGNSTGNTIIGNVVKIDNCTL